MFGNVGVQDPRLSLDEGPAMGLSMWAEWLHYGLQTNEDKLEAITIMSPWLTGTLGA